MSFNVVYDPNGATAGNVPINNNVYSTVPGSPTAAAIVLLPASNFVSGSDTFTRWNDKQDGTGTAYGLFANS
jgi:hypothetical protein